MNDYLLSLILGIVEGLTEFLPVSSTAHLRISEALLHISLSDGYWKMYTIVIQLGAILCLPVYFRERIAKFLSTFPRGERGDRNALTHPLGLTMVAFVVTAIPAFLLTKVIGKHLESLTIMGTALLVGGIVMWIMDALNARSEAAGPVRRRRPHPYLEDGGACRLAQAVWIGACQILSAVFPGLRVRCLRLRLASSPECRAHRRLEFSFFLSIPTMVVATCYDLLKSLRGKGMQILSASRKSTPTGGSCWPLDLSSRSSWHMLPWHGLWPTYASMGSCHLPFTGIIVGALVLVFAARLAG